MALSSSASTPAWNPAARSPHGAEPFALQPVVFQVFRQPPGGGLRRDLGGPIAVVGADHCLEGDDGVGHRARHRAGGVLACRRSARHRSG